MNRDATTKAQRNALRHAAGLSPELDGVFPRRGQHPMYRRLLLRGLLKDAGRGVDTDDHMVEVDLYRITDAGRRLLVLNAKDRKR